jgi:RHS repeat-associated protein
VLYYAHDGNKNVSEVVSDENEISAHYEYAPFGSVLVIHGEMASSNPWRFSSEYHDDISGLVYYNFRNYNAIYGRWVGRDPVAEKGCINLYCMLENQILYSYDFLGLKVSWASRDLSSFFLGNHQFIIFEYDSKDDAPMSVRKLLKEVKCKKTRCKVYVATIGLEQRPLEIDGQKQKHMIWWYVNESEDIEAYKEQFCKKDKRKHFWDWDYQANEIEGFDEPKLVDKIMEGFENFKNNIKDKPTKYDLWDLNCATWVNSLLKYAGVDENQREEKGEFSGIDWGEEDKGLESYFEN